MKSKYNEACTSSDECGYKTKLKCLNGHCLCENTFWEGTLCGKNISLFGSFIGVKWRLLINKDEFRTYLQPCLTRQGDYDNRACSSQQNLTCSVTGEFAGHCYCQATYYFDNGTMKCVPKKLNMVDCSLTAECREDLGLYCAYGKCICKSTDYWSVALSTCRNDFNSFTYKIIK